MNKQLLRFLSTTVFTVVIILGGIGLYRIATDYYTQPLLQSSEVITAEFITGPLTAKTGELCVFKLNNTVTKADWVIVPPVNVYVDSSGSSLVFSSNVPAKYTIIAAIVEEGQPKILTHVCDYGTDATPNPSPLPNPNPTPSPTTLKEWVTQNIPSDGKTQSAMLADCFDMVADAINRGTIKSVDAAYALLRNITQTKIKINIWKSFLDELSVKVSEQLKNSSDVKQLAIVFKEIAVGLRL